MKKKILIVLLALMALVVSSCTPKASEPQIRVEGVWGRQSPKVATAGAFYMMIYNDGSEADKFLSATSPACETVELHESYMMDGGAMGMRPVEGGFIEIPASGSVELKVGGLHVMCIGKLSDFNVGDKYQITMNFEKAGEVTVEAEIKEQ